MIKQQRERLKSFLMPHEPWLAVFYRLWTDACKQSFDQLTMNEVIGKGKYYYPKKWSFDCLTTKESNWLIMKYDKKSKIKCDKRK